MKAPQSFETLGTMRSTTECHNPRRLISVSLGLYVQISPNKMALTVTFLTCIQKVPSLSLCWDTAIPEVYHDSLQSFQANSVTVPELAHDLMKSSLVESCVRWFKYKFWGLIPSPSSGF